MGVERRMRTGVEETLHSGHIRMKMSCCCCQCCRQTRMETAGEDPQTRSQEVPAASLEPLNRKQGEWGGDTEEPEEDWGWGASVLATFG